MSNTGDNAVTGNDRAIEEILGRAAPRPTPPPDAMLKAKLAVQQDWQRQTRRLTTRRRLMLLATAASFVVALALVTNTLLAPIEQPVQVATLDKAIGTVYLLGEQSELNPVADLDAVRSGQTIKTDRNARVGLSWGHGGSLRLDQSTEVRFVSVDRIELNSGRVYFDSQPDSGRPATLTIATSEGDVTHVGTQFMTAVDDATLTVSVREGAVEIGGYHQLTVTEGKQALMVGSRQPELLDVRGFGPDWAWVEITAPVRVVHGQKLTDLLAWFARESGYRYEFVGENIDTEIDQADVRGDSISKTGTPRDAFENSLRINSFDFQYDDENGVIIISHAGR